MKPFVKVFIEMSIFANVFEVMDKDPTLLNVWLLFLLLGVAGFLLGRYRPWLMLITLSLTLLFTWVHLGELHDPFVGPAILREAGKTYFTQSYVAMALGLALHCVGILFRRKISAES